MDNKEQGQMAIKIMADICDWFKYHETMDWNEFMKLQEGRHKELDKIIKHTREKEKKFALGRKNER